LRGAGFLLLTSCGGGLPLLHPAKTLEGGEVRAAAGFSASVATGELADSIRGARSEAAALGSNGGTDETYARGALALASIAPGLAPLVSARVGVGGQVEAGLIYTGRAVRADVRRSFDLSRHWSLSLGAGGSGVLYGHAPDETLPNLDLGRLHGWGADAPALIGYASDSDLYRVWLGARGGWEHVDVGEVRSVPNPAPLGVLPATLSATRLWGGALAGLAIGFRHIHVAMEIDVGYCSVTGDYAGIHTELAGLTLSPGSAVWWTF
jgi:hypothetical protein